MQQQLNALTAKEPHVMRKPQHKLKFQVFNSQARTREHMCARDLCASLLIKQHAETPAHAQTLGFNFRARTHTCPLFTLLTLEHAFFLAVPISRTRVRALALMHVGALSHTLSHTHTLYHAHTHKHTHTLHPLSHSFCIAVHDYNRFLRWIKTMCGIRYVCVRRKRMLQSYMSMYMHMYMYIYMYMYLYMYMYMYVYMYIYMYLYM